MPTAHTVEQVKDYSLELLNALDQTLFMPLYNFQFFYEDTFDDLYSENILGFVMTLLVGGVSMAAYAAAHATKKKREASVFENSYFIAASLLDPTQPLSKKSFEAALFTLKEDLNEALKEIKKSEAYAFEITEEGTRIELKKKNLLKEEREGLEVLPGNWGQIKRFFKRPRIKKTMTAVTLYITVYWVLYMLVQLIQIVFPLLALMPLFLQFILPAILPMGYLIFSSGEIQKKDDEMSAVRVLAIQIFMMRKYEKSFVAKLEEAQQERLKRPSSEINVFKYKEHPIPTVKPVAEFKTRLTETRPKSKFLFHFVKACMFTTFLLWPVTDFLEGYGAVAFFAGLGSVAVPFFIGIVVGIVAGLIAYQAAKKRREKNERTLRKKGLTEETVQRMDVQIARINVLKSEIAALRRQLGSRANDPVLNPQVYFPDYDDHTFFTIGHLKTTQKEYVWSFIKKSLQRFRVFLDDMGSAVYIVCSIYMSLAFCGAFVMAASPLSIVFIVAMVVGGLYGMMGAYQKYHKNQQEKRDNALLKRIQIVNQTLDTHERLLTQQRDYLSESVNVISSEKGTSHLNTRQAIQGLKEFGKQNELKDLDWKVLWDRGRK